MHLPLLYLYLITFVSQTPNLPVKLKLYVGAMVILIDNISFSDRLINGSIGTVKHFDIRSKPLCSTIDDSEAGNSMKDKRFCSELKECVVIIAKTKALLLLKENNFC